MSEPRWRDFELAQLLTEDGDIGRPVDTTSWDVPEGIEVRKQRIYWKYLSRAKRVSTSKEMLPAFCRLWDSPTENIREFATKYGVLEMCVHHLPHTHSKRCELRFAMADGDLRAYDPIEVWRTFSREADALLRIADRVLQGEPGRAEDWNLAFARHQAFYSLPADSPSKQTMAMNRLNLGGLLNEWIQLGDVRPFLDWDLSERKPRFKLGGRFSGLFGALALQLTMAVLQAGGIAICSHCHNDYRTKRQPKRNQKNFCPQCRKKGIPHRIAQAEYQRKKREGE